MKEIQGSVRKDRGRSTESTMNFWGRDYEQRGRSPVSRDSERTGDKMENNKSYFDRDSNPDRSSSKEWTNCCAFCGNDHLEIECTIVPTANLRRNRCLKKELCYYCLRKGHFPSECMKKGICIYCKRSHHSALCRRRFGEGYWDPSPESACDNNELKSFCPSKSDAKNEIMLRYESSSKLASEGKDEKETKEFSGFSNESCLFGMDNYHSNLNVAFLENEISPNPSKSIGEFSIRDNGNDKPCIEARLSEEPKVEQLEVKDFSMDGRGSTQIEELQNPLFEFGNRKGIG
jgi:hypothetical protein